MGNVFFLIEIFLKSNIFFEQPIVVDFDLEIFSKSLEQCLYMYLRVCLLSTLLHNITCYYKQVESSPKLDKMQIRGRCTYVHFPFLAAFQRTS